MATMTEAEKKAAADKEAAEQKAAAEKKAAADKQAAEKAEADKKAAEAKAAAEKAAFDKQADEEAKKGDGSVSAAEQKKIDAMLGDDDESGDDDERSVAKAGRDESGHPEFISVFRKLVAGIPDDTPDDFVLYGAAGHLLRMGHLRAAVKHY